MVSISSPVGAARGVRDQSIVLVRLQLGSTLTAIKSCTSLTSRSSASQPPTMSGKRVGTTTRLTSAACPMGGVTLGTLCDTALVGLSSSGALCPPAMRLLRRASMLTRVFLVRSAVQPTSAMHLFKSASLPECCTAPCEVLGTGPPLWSLIDPANPATGGVSVTYWGVPSLPGDPFPCPADNITGELLY